MRAPGQRPLLGAAYRRTILRAPARRIGRSRPAGRGVPAWLRIAGTLMGLQAVLGALTYLAFDYPWPAMAGGVLFLIATWQVAAELRGRPRPAAWAAAALCQLPALPGTVNVVLVQAGLYRHNSLGDLLDFVMQTWHTVLLPWLLWLPDILVPTPSGELLSPFFLALPLLGPLLMIWVLLSARSGPRV